MRRLLEEIMQVNQEDAAMEPAEEMKPELTPEMMASIIENDPSLADLPQDELEKGIAVEMEHYDSVGGDMNLVAKIAADHIKETPEGKSYYDALEQMEHELQETPEEEEMEHEPGGEEAEIPTEEVPEAVEEEKTDEEVEESVDEGKETPGVPDGTGPYKNSARAQAGKEGMKKEAGQECPKEMKEAKQIKESSEEKETATNEEAQAMIDSGEAEIPPEAVIESPEEAKE